MTTKPRPLLLHDPSPTTTERVTIHSHPTLPPRRELDRSLNYWWSRIESRLEAVFDGGAGGVPGDIGVASDGVVDDDDGDGDAAADYDAPPADDR